MKTYAVWAMGIDSDNTDFVFHENASNFDRSLNEMTWPSSFKKVRVLACPSTFGWPFRRLRALEAGVNLETHIWVGPATDEEIGNDFARLFYREAGTVTANDFLIAPQDEILKELRYRASKRGIYFPDGHDVSSIQENVSYILVAILAQDILFTCYSCSSHWWHLTHPS